MGCLEKFTGFLLLEFFTNVLGRVAFLFFISCCFLLLLLAAFVDYGNCTVWFRCVLSLILLLLNDDISSFKKLEIQDILTCVEKESSIIIKDFLKLCCIELKFS